MTKGKFFIQDPNHVQVGVKTAASCWTQAMQMQKIK